MGLDFWKPGEYLLLDGAMGTVLQNRGMKAGEQPELLNLNHPDWIEAIHGDYIRAGSRVIYTNTFGANGKKLRRTGKSVEEIVKAGIAIARRAVDKYYRKKIKKSPSRWILDRLGNCWSLWVRWRLKRPIIYLKKLYGRALGLI